MIMSLERSREFPGQQLCISLKSNQSLVGQEYEKLQKWICSEGRIRIDRMLHFKGVNYIQMGLTFLL